MERLPPFPQGYPTATLMSKRKPVNVELQLRFKCASQLWEPSRGVTRRTAPHASFEHIEWKLRDNCYGSSFHG